MAESDRAVAVLAPAYLDAILEELLRSVFIPGKNADNLLSANSNSPLGTFSSRIDVAHALGLTKDDAWHDLHLLRATRNDFAHAVNAHSFDYQPVRNRCREFKLQNRWGKVVDTSTRESTRNEFLFVVWALVGEIAESLRNAKTQSASTQKHGT
jgi:DNA-binding MltR family transcriptional regulator